MKTAFRFLLLAALPLAGCETTVEVDPPAHTPRLSINYTLSNQAPTADYRRFFDGRDLYVSTSQSVLQTSRLLGRADATAELRDASGQVVEVFRPRGRPGYPDSVRGYYVPVRGYVGRPGQAYTLRVSAPYVEPIEATLTLPAPATLADGRYALNTDPYNYQYRGRLTFNILDNPATTDYYLAYARVLDTSGQLWGYVVQDYSARNSDSPDLKLNRFDLSAPNGYYSVLPLGDAGRNGQPLSFSSDVYLSGYRGTNGPGPKPAVIEVVVSSIPADTYNFYQSIQRYYDTDGNPFAEPAPLRSNVPNGYGLFGGATDAMLRIPL